jgi:hypothetical protein
MDDTPLPLPLRIRAVDHAITAYLVVFTLTLGATIAWLLTDDTNTNTNTINDTETP